MVYKKRKMYKAIHWRRPHIIFEMERRGKEDEEFPPGFSRNCSTTVSSPENHASLSMSTELSSTEEVINRQPKLKLKFKREDNLKSAPADHELLKQTKSTRTNRAIVMAKTSEPNKKAKTSDDASIKGETDSGDVLSFHGENGEVYTLSGPPKAPNRDLDLVRTPQADSPLVACVKKGLISFITEAGLNDVGHVITQANNIFALLQTMKADYGSFYDVVRAYIRHCLEWHSAEEERKRCKTSAVDCYDSLLRHLDEMKKDVLVAKDDIERAKGYMSPLKARLQDMKEMVEKLEIELEESVSDLRSLEARKVEKMKEMAAVDVELKATGDDAEKMRRIVRDNRARIEAARVCMEKVKNELKTM